jgi:hypothetical protein
VAEPVVEVTVVPSPKSKVYVSPATESDHGLLNCAVAVTGTPTYPVDWPGFMSIPLAVSGSWNSVAPRSS